MHHCQLCGFEFDEANMACHAECPLGSHCHLICCPNCGYQVVDQTKSLFARLLMRWWPSPADPGSKPGARAKAANPHSVPLTHVRVGKTVEIESLGHIPPHRLNQLCIYGLVPGSLVELLQRRPEPIVRIGETELALAQEILEQIWVRP